MSDLIVQAEIGAAREHLDELFRSAIREVGSYTVTPSYWFWWRAVMYVCPLDVHEARVWADRYADELCAWLQLNYPHPERFMGTGVYTRQEHVLSVH